MSRKIRRPARSAQGAETPPPDLGLLLDEIEKEPMPEKLLALALKLQEALVQRRHREERAATPEEPAAREKVRQSR